MDERIKNEKKRRKKKKTRRRQKKKKRRKRKNDKKKKKKKAAIGSNTVCSRIIQSDWSVELGTNHGTWILLFGFFLQSILHSIFIFFCHTNIV